MKIKWLCFASLAENYTCSTNRNDDDDGDGDDDDDAPGSKISLIRI